MRYIKTLALLLALLSLAACESFELNKQYVAGDRATYDVIEPYTRAQVAEDENLSDTQRTALNLVLDSWRLRLEKGEAYVEED